MTSTCSKCINVTNKICRCCLASICKDCETKHTPFDCKDCKSQLCCDNCIIHKETTKCLLCKKDHIVKQCKQFVELPITCSTKDCEHRVSIFACCGYEHKPYHIFKINCIIWNLVKNTKWCDECNKPYCMTHITNHLHKQKTITTHQLS